MKLRFGLLAAALLTFLWSPPAEGKNRPTVDDGRGLTCFADAETDQGCFGAICYCCYDNGCWICGRTGEPSDQCVWDDSYRAKIGTSLETEPLSVDPKRGDRVAEEALINVLEEKKVTTRKELLEEIMKVRKARTRGALENGKLEESVGTQKRINRYFHSVVMPKLKTCWNQVQGSGTIEMKYSYEDKAREGWAFKALKVGKSDLPKGQDEVALACMQKAVTATSFPKEKGEAGASYSINWSWPVPLPPDTAQQAEAMFRSNGGSGGGGCDGHGAAAKCVTCAGYPVSCVAVCVGGDPPCEMTENPLPGGFRRTCTVGTGCASGGGFGVVGGWVIY